MNKDQKRWLKRLKKCLDEMPADSEISVVQENDECARISINPRGAINELCSEHSEKNWPYAGDPQSKYSEVALGEFHAKHVIANSESY